MVFLNGYIGTLLSSRLSAHGRSSDRFHLMDHRVFFSFEPVLHNWCNNSRGMCYPVCRKVPIKDSLLLIRNSNPCSCGSGFPLSLSLWSLTICSTPYNRKQNVLMASLSETSLSHCVRICVRVQLFIIYCLLCTNMCNICFKCKC